MTKVKLKIEDAVDKVLAHDVTGIIPSKFKGPIFKKGHRIKKEDIEKLKKAGKENIWVLTIDKDEYHEDEAAEEFKKLAGENIETTGPVEGKVVFKSTIDGLLIADKEIIGKINHIDNIVFTTRHTEIPVTKGEELAGIRIVPLAIKKRFVNKVLRISKRNKPLNVIPFQKKEVGIIITGNEIYSGKIEDKFGDIIERKIEKYGSKINEKKILPDDKEKIKNTIIKMSESCDFIIITGGMSVDPDDVTVNSVKEAGAKIITHGAPILPGNMFLVAYLKNNIPIFGVPGAAVYYNITVFDIFLPFVLANKIITKEDIISRGYGGYCTHCKVCIFPYCSFGKK